MRVLMRTTAASPECIMHSGKVYNVGSEIGDELVEKGFAEPAPRDAKVERTPAQPDPEDTPEPVDD
jgi:hypothetical protein